MVFENEQIIMPQNSIDRLRYQIEETDFEMKNEPASSLFKFDKQVGTTAEIEFKASLEEEKMQD